MKLRFQGNYFYVNDHLIILTHPLYGLIELDSLVLVLIYGFSSKQMESLPARNIYAFDSNGSQVWKIEEPLQYRDCLVSYADIRLENDGRIIAGSTKGDEYILNIDDGTVSHIKGLKSW